VPGWAVAACVGAVCSLLFMLLDRDKSLCWRAWFPVLVVVGLDAAGAAVILPFLKILHLPAAIPTYWHVIVAGLLGPPAHQNQNAG
jgi:hypothetical protein